jgi:hypothetical protein
MMAKIPGKHIGICRDMSGPMHVTDLSNGILGALNQGVFMQCPNLIPQTPQCRCTGRRAACQGMW